jgi:hypothetical protein
MRTEERDEKEKGQMRRDERVTRVHPVEKEGVSL